MLFGMTWWASIFLLSALLMLVMELTGITGDEDGEETTIFDYTVYFGRLLYYLLSSFLIALYFQPLDGSLLIAILAAYILASGLFIVGVDIFTALKGVFDKDSDKTSKENGKSAVAISLFSYFLIYSFYLCGVWIAYSSLQKTTGLFI